MIVQLAISRTREYGADRGGAEMHGNPRALASALAKLAHGAQAIPNPVAERNPAAAALYIVPGLRRAATAWFSTHPATENRIAALEAMAGEMGLHSPPPCSPARRRARRRCRSAASEPQGASAWIRTVAAIEPDRRVVFELSRSSIRFGAPSMPLAGGRSSCHLGFVHPSLRHGGADGDLADFGVECMGFLSGWPRWR